jgi:hypothetical protein
MASPFIRKDEVAVVVMVLFVYLVLATCRSLQAVRRLTQSRTCR